MVKLKGYPLLNNINMLYFIFVLAIINVGGFIYIKDNQSIFLFAVISIIIYFFNKNMIIVLLSSMIIINTLIFLNTLSEPIEGLKNKEDEEDEEKEGLENEDDDDEKEGYKNKKEEGLDNEEPKEEHTVGELSKIDDETGTKEIQKSIKKILPILKTNYNTLSLDINNINKEINKLTSILG
jgi:hypothetical protein